MEAIELVYTIEAAPFRKALKRYLWRRTSGYIAGLVIALLLALAVGRSEPWLSGFVTGAAVAFLAQLVRLFRGGLRQAVARDRSRVLFRIDDQGLAFDSDWGRRSVPWARLRAVRREGEFVELDLGPTESPVWVPLAVVAGEPLARLEAAVRPGVRAQ